MPEDLCRPCFVRLDPAFRRALDVTTTYTPAQAGKAYSFPTGINGNDAVIGIIELGGGYHPSDVNAAFAEWHLPAPHLTDVGQNKPGDDADTEVLLDIQVAAGIYSYCTGRPAVVRTYFAPNTDQGFAAAVQQAAVDGCATISISWGAPESNWGSTACKAFDAVCAAAGAKGSTIFAASGDNLSGDGAGDGKPHVDFPAASPNVVGCGGTHKTASAEIVWNEGGGGTGGGFSAIFPVQPWQVGAPNGGGRMVPDVAGIAAPSTGWRVFQNGAWTVVGGTSAVSPMYAGLFAALASAAGKKLGNVLPTIWSRPAAFTDITVGTNGQWRAAQGPDPCTGLGVPIGTALANLFAGTGTQPPPPAGDGWTLKITGTGPRPTVAFA